jgi:biotin operon repressor BirA-like protein
MAVSTPRGVTQRELLALLADGRLHSGERLAEALGVSRAAVWKSIDKLRELGIDVASLSRRGYALAQPVELLDVRRLRLELGAAQAAALRELELNFEVDSTNARLLAAPPPPPGARPRGPLLLPARRRGPPRPAVDRTVRRRHRPVAGLVFHGSSARASLAQSRRGGRGGARTGSRRGPRHPAQMAQ